MSDLPRRTGPEDEGIPDYADDTSTAFDEADRPRFEGPAALPADRPQAVDEYGTTAAEAREGESLEDRLDREEPDPAAGGPWPEGGGELTDEVVAEGSEAQAARDADVLGAPDGPDPGEGPGAAGTDPAARRASTGRLVEPDEGARPDTEADVLADDRGGRAYAAEEDAVHVVPQEEVPMEDLPPDERPGAGADQRPGG